MSENNEKQLYHHGTKGMKWGQRLYQYKDGTLTPLGRRRAESLKRKYLKTTGKQLKGRALSTKGKVTKEQKKENTTDTQSAAPKKQYRPLQNKTDDQIKKATERMKIENEYYNALISYHDNISKLNPKKVAPKKVSLGKKFVKKTMKDVILPAAIDSGKVFLKNYFNDVGNDIRRSMKNNKKKN